MQNSIRGETPNVPHREAKKKSSQEAKRYLTVSFLGLRIYSKKRVTAPVHPLCCILPVQAKHHPRDAFRVCENSPSGLASLPDCFFLDRFAF